MSRYNESYAVHINPEGKSLMKISVQICNNLAEDI